VNVIGKIFSLLLRNRLNKWCKQNHVFNESQFGFRDNHSTADCIFILHYIIQKVLTDKSKLYCEFIDHEKAFDTIVRDALSVKL
jgi:mRNA-degrading endonuclease YafQ of YafQ-DinJ toxin-antitoxin module